MIKWYTDKERLFALLTGLECQNIEEIMIKSPAFIKRLGVEISKAARFGAEDYKEYREKND